MLQAREGLTEGFERARIVIQKIATFVPARLHHFERSPLGHRRHGRIHADDAVHNAAHRNQIVDGKEDDGDEDQPHGGQTIGHSPTQGGRARQDSHRFSAAPSHPLDSSPRMWNALVVSLSLLRCRIIPQNGLERDKFRMTLG